MNLAEEIALWKQTGNHAHATDILYQLSKVLADSKYQNIERDHDVTVGKSSGGEIKSGLLWAVIDSHEAKNHALHRQNAIMVEALQIIRTKSRCEPVAGDIADKALKKILVRK